MNDVPDSAGRVYIFGAGASRAETIPQKLPLPLANEFFEKRYLEAHWHWTSMGMEFEKSELRSLLHRYFTSSTTGQKAEPFHSTNVEEVYSFLEAFKSIFVARTFEPQNLTIALDQLMRYIVHVIRYGSWRLDESPVYEVFAKQLHENDTIVSFNWDTLIDSALAKSRIGSKLLEHVSELANPQNSGIRDDGQAVRELHRGAYLKLHGSTNLTTCSNTQCLRHSYPFVWALNVESPEDWPCTFCGSPTRVLLVPPNVRKTYAGNRFFNLQATIAAEKTAMAGEIILIGYSLPVFDFEARTMLRCSRMEDDNLGANLRRVIVVNPNVRNPGYLRTVNELFGLRGKRAYGHRVDLVTYESIDLYFAAELRKAKRGAASSKRRRK